MKKIVLLVGKCATGKTTVETMLLKHPKINRLISYTTRPRRSNETDGVDYNFINDKGFDKLKNSDGLLETTEYTVNGVLFRYGLPKVNLSEDKINLAVVNPHGLSQILSKIDSDTKVLTLLFEAPTMTRIIRYLGRETDEGKYKRLCERLLQDENDFVYVKKDLKEKNIPFVVIDNPSYVSLDELYNNVLNNILNFK